MTGRITMQAKTNGRKTGRKISAILMIIAAAVVLFGGCGLFHNDSAEKHIGFSTEAAVDSITLKWKKQDDIDYYEIYRTDISEGVYNGDETSLRSKDYENIAQVNGDQRVYRDTDVISGHTYAYVVSGFHKSFGHVKQVCTSFIEDNITYETAGLSKPGLLNNGDGENYENSKNSIYLYCEVYDGIDPDGTEVYRKSNTDPDYKKIKCKYLDSEKEILDDTVTPGETYTYKARTYAEQDGRKYFSPDSDEVTIPAVNFSADYDVETVDITESMLIIKVMSAAGNGVTSFDAGMPARFTVKKDSQREGRCFSAKLIGWSKTSSATNEQWNDVPKNGVQIRAGESIFLKYQLSAWDDGDVSINEPECALFMDNTDWGGAKYDGSGRGTTIMTLDLLTGKGTAYCDWDY